MWFLEVLVRPTRRDEPEVDEEELETAAENQSDSEGGGRGMDGTGDGDNCLGRGVVSPDDSASSALDFGPSSFSASSLWRARSFFMPPSPAYGLVSLTRGLLLLPLTFLPERSLSSCMRTSREDRRDLNMSGVVFAVMASGRLEERIRVGRRGVL